MSSERRCEVIDYRCEQCGASFSLPLELQCDDHRPVPTRAVEDVMQALIDSVEKAKADRHKREADGTHPTSDAKS